MTIKNVIISSIIIFIIIIPSGIDSFKMNPDRIILLDYHGFRYEPTAQSDHLLGFRLKPGVSMNGFRHNSHGFVGPEFNNEKPNGTFRIFCLGGSTTLGAGVMTDLFSYPEILQSIFDKTFQNDSRRIEVINSGMFGYNTLHTYIQITELLDVYRPDMYIIMDGLNDLDLAQYLSLTKLKNLFGKKTSEADVGIGLQSIEEKFALAGYKRNLQNAISHAKRKGIQVVIVSDPLKIDPNHEARLSQDNPGLASLLSFGRTVLPETNRELATENNICFVNVQTVLDAFLSTPREVNRVWADDLHLTRYGYYLVARTIYRQLMSTPSIQDAVGSRRTATDEELDLLFPELVQWRPADGMGWAKDVAAPHGELETNNIKDSVPGGEWRFYAPSDPDLPAEINVTLDPGVTGFRIYPRIHGSNDSVAVFQLLPDGESRLLFKLQKPTEDGLWSPQTAWYEVRMPKGQEGSLVIRLTGENAQLWHKEMALLFAPESCE